MLDIDLKRGGVTSYWPGDIPAVLKFQQATESDGPYLWVGCRDGQLCRIDIDRGETRAWKVSGGAGVRSLCVQGDRAILVGTSEGAVLQFSLGDGFEPDIADPAVKLEPHKAPVTFLGRFGGSGPLIIARRSEPGCHVFGDDDTISSRLASCEVDGIRGFLYEIASLTGSAGPAATALISDEGIHYLAAPWRPDPTGQCDSAGIRELSRATVFDTTRFAGRSILAMPEGVCVGPDSAAGDSARRHGSLALPQRNGPCMALAASTDDNCDWLWAVDMDGNGHLYKWRPPTKKKDDWLAGLEFHGTWRLPHAVIRTEVMAVGPAEERLVAGSICQDGRVVVQRFRTARAVLRQRSAAALDALKSSEEVEGLTPLRRWSKRAPAWQVGTRWDDTWAAASKDESDDRWHDAQRVAYLIEFLSEQAPRAFLRLLETDDEFEGIRHALRPTNGQRVDCHVRDIVYAWLSGISRLPQPQRRRGVMGVLRFVSRMAEGKPQPHESESKLEFDTAAISREVRRWGFQLEGKPPPRLLRAEGLGLGSSLSGEDLRSASDERLLRIMRLLRRQIEHEEAVPIASEKMRDHGGNETDRAGDVRHPERKKEEDEILHRRRERSARATGRRGAPLLALSHEDFVVTTSEQGYIDVLRVYDNGNTAQPRSKRVLIVDLLEHYPGGSERRTEPDLIARAGFVTKDGIALLALQPRLKRRIVKDGLPDENLVRINLNNLAARQESDPLVYCRVFELEEKEKKGPCPLEPDTIWRFLSLRELVGSNEKKVTLQALHAFDRGEGPNLACIGLGYGNDSAQASELILIDELRLTEWNGDRGGKIKLEGPGASCWRPPSRSNVAEGHHPAIRAVVAKGDWIFVGGDDGAVWGFEPQDAKNGGPEPRTGTRIGALGSPVTSLCALTLKDDNRRRVRVYAGGSDGALAAWNAPSRKEDSSTTGPMVWATRQEAAVLGLLVLNRADDANRNGAEPGAEGVILVSTADGRGLQVADIVNPRSTDSEAEGVQSASPTGKFPGARVGRPRLGRGVLFERNGTPWLVGPDGSLRRMTRHGALRSHAGQSLWMTLGSWMGRKWHSQPQGEQAPAIAFLRVPFLLRNYAPLVMEFLLAWLVLPDRLASSSENGQQTVPAVPDRINRLLDLPRPVVPIALLDYDWRVATSQETVGTVEDVLGQSGTGGSSARILEARNRVCDSVRTSIGRLWLAGAHREAERLVQFVLVRLNADLVAAFGQESSGSAGARVNAVDLERLYAQLLDTLRSTLGGSEGDDPLALSHIQSVYAQFLPDHGAFRALVARVEGSDEGVEAQSAKAVLRARLAAIRSILSDAHPVVVLELLRSCNLSLVQFFKNHPRTGERPRASVSWSTIKGYARSLHSLGARIMLSSPESDEILQHELARGFALLLLLVRASPLEVGLTLADCEPTGRFLTRVRNQVELLASQLFVDEEDEADKSRATAAIDFVAKERLPRSCRFVLPDQDIPEFGSCDVPPTALDQLRGQVEPLMHALGTLTSALEGKPATWDRCSLPGAQCIACNQTEEKLRTRPWFTEEDDRSTPRVAGTQLSDRLHEAHWMLSWALRQIPEEDDDGGGWKGEIQGSFRHTLRFWQARIGSLKARTEYWKKRSRLATIRPGDLRTAREVAEWAENELKLGGTIHDELGEYAWRIARGHLEHLRGAASSLASSAAAQTALVQSVLHHNILEDLDIHALQLSDISAAVNPVVREQRAQGTQQLPPYMDKRERHTHERLATHIEDVAQRGRALPRSIRVVQAILHDMVASGPDEAHGRSNETDDAENAPIGRLKAALQSHHGIQREDGAIAWPPDSPIACGPFSDRDARLLAHALAEIYRNRYEHEVRRGCEDSTAPIAMSWEEEEEEGGRRTQTLTAKTQTLLSPSDWRRLSSGKDGFDLPQDRHENANRRSSGVGLYIATLAAAFQEWSLEVTLEAKGTGFEAEEDEALEDRERDPEPYDVTYRFQRTPKTKAGDTGE